MMNFTDCVLCLLAGFAIPLALASLVAEGLAPLSDGRASVSARARTSLYWLAALAAGPGLFALRLFAGLKSGEEGIGEQIAGWCAASGWAVLYGYVVLSGVRLSAGLG